MLLNNVPSNLSPFKRKEIELRLDAYYNDRCNYDKTIVMIVKIHETEPNSARLAMLRNKLEKLTEKLKYSEKFLAIALSEKCEHDALAQESIKQFFDQKPRVVKGVGID
jgi:hypothetical protein